MVTWTWTNHTCKLYYVIVSVITVFTLLGSLLPTALKSASYTSFFSFVNSNSTWEPWSCSDLRYESCRNCWRFSFQWKVIEIMIAWVFWTTSWTSVSDNIDGCYDVRAFCSTTGTVLHMQQACMSIIDNCFGVCRYVQCVAGCWSVKRNRMQKWLHVCVVLKLAADLVSMNTFHILVNVY